jgi:hypothetical protein
MDHSRQGRLSPSWQRSQADLPGWVHDCPSKPKSLRRRVRGCFTGYRRWRRAASARESESFPLCGPFPDLLRKMVKLKAARRSKNNTFAVLHRAIEKMVGLGPPTRLRRDERKVRDRFSYSGVTCVPRLQRCTAVEKSSKVIPPSVGLEAARRRSILSGMLAEELHSAGCHHPGRKPARLHVARAQRSPP